MDIDEFTYLLNNQFELGVARKISGPIASTNYFYSDWVVNCHRALAFLIYAALMVLLCYCNVHCCSCLLRSSLCYPAVGYHGSSSLRTA